MESHIQVNNVVSKKIVVIGGAGFVGFSIVAKLNDTGYQVKVLTSNRERAKHLILLPQVVVETCDVSDETKLSAAVAGCDAIINLAGILHESKSRTFDATHHQLPKRLVKVCAEQGLYRLLHISALGANVDAPSDYLKSKFKGESAISTCQQPMHWTIFKPSVIFGRGDRFLNLFATLVRYLPVIFLAKPEARFQPIWVEDVASIVVGSLENDDTYHKTYELAGPTVYSLRELVEKVMYLLGKERLVIGLSDRLSFLQAYLLEWLPVKLMSRDNVRSMAVDSVATEPLSPEIAWPLTPLEAVMPEYILDKTLRAKYSQFRAAAGRAIHAKR